MESLLIGKYSNHPITIPLLVGKPSGDYWVKFNYTFPPVKLYVLVEPDGKIWMRAQKKQGKKFSGASPDFLWDA